MAAVALLLFVAIAVIPVAADTPWSGYKDINIKNANGIRFDKNSNEMYYYKLGGGGLNALHITHDPINVPSGAFNKTTSTSGTFWLSDTGGRGFDDDAILFIAVNGTPDSNFKVHITSSGYNWTPTGALNQLPAIGNIAYNASAVSNAEFSMADFTQNDDSDNIDTYWRPSTSATFPVFNGQNMADTAVNNFKFIPVDLKVGIIGTNANSTYNGSLIDHGAVKVDYTIAGIPTNAVVAFNAYAWCNQSNQGQGISWTNSVNTSAQGPGSSYSGWLVDPV